MSDERKNRCQSQIDSDTDLQDWFKRSVEEPLQQPFTLMVLGRVKRRERRLKVQRYAAWLAVFSSVCLLLPELITPLNMLAALPLVVADVGSEQWPVLMIVAMSPAYWLIKQARNTGFLRRA